MCDKKCFSHGLIAGLIAGIAFTFFLLLGDMNEKVGPLIGLPTELDNMVVHFIVSLIAGLVFAFCLGWLVHSWVEAIFWGILFGLLMWLLGPLTFLPKLTAGAPLFARWNLAGIETTIHSLIGHLVYGLILGLVYCFLKKGKLHKLKVPKKH